MKAKVKIISFIMFLTFLLPPSFSKASFFVMNLQQDSIYTPGKINLSLNLTEAAKFESGYQFRISVFITGTLIREQILEAMRGRSVNFELTIPEVFERTEARCRCELLIAEDFIEAKERPLVLWPLVEPYPSESLKNKEVWVYDTSGKLLELFEKLDVQVVDATFQTARDFGYPDIVFIGQNTDPNNMRILVNRLMSVETEPVIIYLKQKQFLKEAKVEVPIENNISRIIKCTRDNPFLIDLDFRDILSLANNASYLKIKKDEDIKRIINSYIYEAVQDEKYIYSYLCTIQQDEQVTIYCQLPITDREDPRFMVLLKNLLRYADSISNEIKIKQETSY